MLYIEEYLYYNSRHVAAYAPKTVRRLFFLPAAAAVWTGGGLRARGPSVRQVRPLAPRKGAASTDRRVCVAASSEESVRGTFLNAPTASDQAGRRSRLIEKFRLP